MSSSTVVDELSVRLKTVSLSEAASGRVSRSAARATSVAWTTEMRWRVRGVLSGLRLMRVEWRALRSAIWRRVPRKIPLARVMGRPSFHNQVDKILHKLYHF